MTPRTRSAATGPGCANNWPHFIRQEADGGPAWLVGHSLGGMLSLMVACRHPELVRGLVLLDSPVITGWRAHSLRVAKATGLVKRVSPGRVSQNRRHHWPSAQAAHDHFATERAPSPAGRRACWMTTSAPARCRPTTVVCRWPSTATSKPASTTRCRTTWAALLKKHPPRCPVGFVAGTQSVEIRQVGLATTKALVRERLRWLEGTHLFPMEKPAETAAVVLELADIACRADRPPGQGFAPPAPRMGRGGRAVCLKKRRQARASTHDFGFRRPTIRVR